MDPIEKRKHKQVLLFIASATAVICLVILFFFKTGIFLSAASTLLDILMPFIFGAVIAYLLRPVCLAIERFLRNLFDPKSTGKRAGLLRLIAILLSLALLLVALFLLIMAVLPELIRSIGSIITQIPGALESFSKWLSSLDTGSGLSHEIVTEVQNAAGTLSTSMTDLMESKVLPYLQTLVSGVTNSFRGIIDVVKNFGLGCIISAYFLGSWEKFADQGRLVLYALFPKHAADFLCGELRFANRKFSGFVRGQLLDSMMIGIICFVFTMIAGIPYAVLVSVVVGVTNMIPFFGPYLGAIPSALIIFTVSPGKCIMFVVLIIILQQIDGNIISPKILGDKVGLSGFWILFSILLFGALFGLVGMLIGVPLFAVIYDLIGKLVSRGLKKHGQVHMEEEYRARFSKEK